MTIQTFCPQCGAAVLPNSEFCGSCGFRISGGDAAVAEGSGAAQDYAGFWQRFLAYFIDGIILIFIAGIPSVLIGVLVDSPRLVTSSISPSRSSISRGAMEAAGPGANR
jgi:hypothetical protein